MNIKYDKNNPVPGVPGIKFSGNASITVSATGISIKTREKPDEGGEVSKLKQENRPAPSLPEGYEVIDNALLHPDGFIIAIEKRQKVTTVKTPMIVEIFMQKLDEVDARALAIWLQRRVG